MIWWAGRAGCIMHAQGRSKRWEAPWKHMLACPGAQLREGRRLARLSWQSHSSDGTFTKTDFSVHERVQVQVSG